MRLKFLGRGSAFNVSESNTSAYYKNENGLMLLIDCGETVFGTIKQNNILNDVQKLHIVISHTHSDHIGSLGSLCLLNFFARKQKTNIVLSGKEDLDVLVKNVLAAFGIDEKYINFVTINDLLNDFKEFESFEYVKGNHVAEIPTYGFLINHKTDGITYYSSDTNDVTTLKSLILNKKNKTDAIYIDTCKADYPGNVHLSARILLEVVPQNFKDKIWCMHLDNAAFEPDLINMEFNVVNHRKDLNI